MADMAQQQIPDSPMAKALGTVSKLLDELHGEMNNLQGRLACISRNSHGQSITAEKSPVEEVPILKEIHDIAERIVDRTQQLKGMQERLSI